MRPALILPALVLAFGCATGSNTPGAAADGDARCWPVVPLELQALEHGREWEPIANLLPDGTITNRRGPLGRISDDHLSIGKDKQVLLEGSCAGRAVELTSPFNPALHGRASYDERGALHEVSGFGATIFVADDGFVEASLGNGHTWFGRPGSGGGVVRVTGEIRRARRTAAMLVYTAVAFGAGR